MALIEVSKGIFRDTDDIKHAEQIDTLPRFEWLRTLYKNDS
jgi:hypothetical protein